MPTYALLLPHAADRYEGLSPEAYGDIMQDYFAWIQSKVETGAFQGGHKLSTSEGRWLRSTPSGVETHTIPSAELAEVVGGIMLIEAASLEAAVAEAKDHPHLKHNTNIFILPVDPSAED